jgi:hypothetical protein
MRVFQLGNIVVAKKFTTPTQGDFHPPQLAAPRSHYRWLLKSSVRIASSSLELRHT